MPALCDAAEGADGWSLTIDGCDQCGGVWFDANELGMLAQTGQTAVGWAEQLFEPGE